MTEVECRYPEEHTLHEHFGLHLCVRCGRPIWWGKPTCWDCSRSIEAATRKKKEPLTVG